ncbi:MAG: 50S ribosomal protein L21 [Candidatus Shikimatogenerans bostrichidophilus]|nr:MAG: 50S ribosomal protein L21 [Candidatus Shikimatogenerans bostrichidophilus]
MYKKAIVLLKNNQYLVYPKKYIYVNKLNLNINTKLNIKKILLIVNKFNNVLIGNPYLKQFIVKTIIVNHLKNKKIIIFKKKKRKGYKIKRGHRQQITKLKIISIKKNGT